MARISEMFTGRKRSSSVWTQVSYDEKQKKSGCLVLECSMFVATKNLTDLKNHLMKHIIGTGLVPTSGRPQHQYSVNDPGMTSAARHLSAPRCSKVLQSSDSSESATPPYHGQRWTWYRSQLLRHCVDCSQCVACLQWDDETAWASLLMRTWLKVNYSELSYMSSSAETCWTMWSL